MSSKKTIQIVREQHQSSENWHIRHRTHKEYSHPHVDFVAWTMKHVPLRGDERVLDVGCGVGLYYEYLLAHHPEITYVGLDFSAAMLAEHKSDQIVRGDVARLPFEDDTFDVVMANHMLYFIGNVEAALVELKRVLKPGGMLVTTTSSSQTMPQFRELFRRAILLVSPPGTSRDVSVPTSLYQRYSLDNASRLLGRYFYAVVRHDLPTMFIFDEAEPIMDYLESLRDLYELQLPDNISWAQVMLIVREQVMNITTNNRLVVDKLSGVLIATDSGGFISEYVTQQQALTDKADKSS